MSSFTLHLFGPLRVLVDGDPWPRVRTRSAEWLLALLVLRHGRAATRSWLAGTLWPDSEESQALHNLRNALLHLRKALGSQAVRLQSPTRDTLTLDLRDAEVDVIVFDQAVRTRDDALLQRAVEVYTGPLLEGCYEEWVSPERETRAAQCLAALEGLAERAQERGEHGMAVRYLRQAEALDPLRESVVRRLLACLAAVGEVAAAGEAYRRFRQLLYETMAATPDRETILLYQQIRTRARDTARPPTLSPAASSLSAQSSREPPVPTASSLRPPHPLAPLIGREEELETVQEQLRRHRLVTLLGAGGVGKTRLAQEMAARLAGGVVWVELAPLTEEALLLPTLAAALGLGVEGVSAADALWSRVVERLFEEPCLLILDNCEHLIEEVARFTQDLLARCLNLRVLTTSRKRLGLTGEVTWRVPSLACPPEPGAGQTVSFSTSPSPESAVSTDLLDFPAVRLFIERAVAIRPGFQLASHEEVEAVCRICRRLDGIPLALELAAARANVLTVRQIDSRLDDRFRLLIGGNRAASPRHQTLQALIDWCYYQLSEPEQTLLRRLSVFTGGWTLEAAGQVGADPAGAETGPAGSAPAPIKASQVLDLLASLEDRSLVLVEETAEGLRYRMLETVREYGRERLQAAGEEDVSRRWHRDYCLRLAEDAHAAWDSRREAAPWAALDREYDNIRAALDYGLHTRDGDNHARLLRAMLPYWRNYGALSEGRRHWQAYQESLRALGAGRERALALHYCAEMASDQGDREQGLAYAQEANSLFRALGDEDYYARTLVRIGEIYRHLQGFEQGKPYYEEAIAVWRGLGKRIDAARTALTIATGGEGRRCSQEYLDAAREAGDLPEVVIALHSWSCLEFMTGDFGAAQAHAEEAFHLCCSLSDRIGELVEGQHLGWIHLAQGDFTKARTYMLATLPIQIAIERKQELMTALQALADIAMQHQQWEYALVLYSVTETLIRTYRLNSAEGRAMDTQAQLAKLRTLLEPATFDRLWLQGGAFTTAEAIKYALRDSSS